MQYWYSCSFWKQAWALHHYYTSQSWCGLHPPHSQRKRCVIFVVLLCIFLVSKIPIVETITCVLIRQPTRSTINRNSELQIPYYTTSVRTLFTCDFVYINTCPPYFKKVSFSLPLTLFIFHPEQNKLQSPAKRKEPKGTSYLKCCSLVMF